MLRRSTAFLLGSLLGTPIDPRQAGQLFPVEWKK
jgi:hypothetical protein